MPRNNGVDETTVVKTAASILQDRLPKTWHADATAGPQQTPGGYDAVLTLSSPDGAGVAYLVKAKSVPRGSAKEMVDQLRVLASAGTDQPLLFITEYVNPPLRRELEDAAISYLDTTGWAYLTSGDPAVMIRLEGASKPPRPRENAATTRLNGPAAARAIRCLLQAQPPLGIRELAKRSSTSPAAVSKLMPTLADAGAIERSANGTITRIRRRTLLDRWIADYSFMNSNGVVLDWIAPRGIARTLERIRERDDIVVSGSAAAREYLPVGMVSVVPLGLLALYGDDIAGIAHSLGLIRADRRISNVVITKPRDQTLLDNAERSPSGFQAVPVAQALADLLTLPRARLAQEAEQLIDALAENDGSWRE